MITARARSAPLRRPPSFAVAAFAVVLLSGCGASTLRPLTRSGPPDSAPSPGPALSGESVERVREAIARGRYRLADSLATACRAGFVPIDTADSLRLAELLDLASDAVWRAGDVRSPRCVE